MMTENLSEKAWGIVCEFIQDNGLRRHCQAVGAAMAWYAAQRGENVDYWQAVGIIHDFDWEIHPQLPDHPVKGSEILRERGWDEPLIRTVLSHYEAGSGVAPQQPIDFALCACDEITGLIIATTLVRPNRNILDVELSSLKKKWKNQAFAAGVNRHEVETATAQFSHACYDGQLDLWTHIGNVLQAMQAQAATLGLTGE